MPPGNVVVFYALAVTVKCSVDQLFSQLLEGWSGSFNSFGMCFEGDN